MKKKIALLLCTSLSLTLFACRGNNSHANSATSNIASAKNSGSSENDISSVKLAELLEQMCRDTKVPAHEIFELNKENFELYSFIKWTDGLAAACSEGQISTDAHSLVLIRANGTDTKAMAEAIAAKADPRKWICVGAEISKVLYTNNYVLMVMTYKDAYEGIKENFEKIIGEEAKVVEMKNSGNLG